MPRILGLVNMHSAPDFAPLTNDRSCATLPLLGRYAFVDVPLSNLSNSGINTMGIMVNRSPRSMIKHMDNAMSYTANTKLGKTILCYNEKYANDLLYNTDINNIIENDWLLKENNYKYVVVTPTHILYRMDYSKVIEAHIASGAGVTCVFKKCADGKSKYMNQNIMDVDNFGHLSQIRKNLGVEDEINLSMETYVFSMDKLMEILAFSKETSKSFSLSDAINFICGTTKVNTYEFDGFFTMVASMSDYLKCSLELLDFSVLSQLFSNDWPIFTKTHDTPPAMYKENAWVRNSFISNGALINGKVENSVICRDTKIDDSAHVKNSIVLSEAEIAPGIELEYVIVDKNAKVIHVKELKGTLEKPIYVAPGDVI